LAYPFPPDQLLALAGVGFARVVVRRRADPRAKCPTWETGNYPHGRIGLPSMVVVFFLFQRYIGEGVKASSING
jgi:hypothetical protein